MKQYSGHDLLQAPSYRRTAAAAEAMPNPDAMNRVTYRRTLPWVGLCFVLILFLVSILRLHPTNFFGLTQDDTIYFSSAQALAAGRGYILPSIPGAPPATKYPILYPWILSWVWRWNPSFPSNVADAVGFTVACGIAYVILAFVFLRRLRGIGDGAALLLTAFCALHPEILFYSASVLTDIPFSALALGALLVADRAMRREAGAAGAAGCAILTGGALLMRVLGAPIALGIIFAAAARRAWKQTGIFAACAAPFFASVAWRAIAAGRASVPAQFAPAGPAFRTTWLYYTSYIGFRKLSMMNAHLIGSMLLSQMTYFFTDLPGYFLWPLFHHNIPLLFVCTLAVFWMIFAGMVREARHSRWQPIHFALLLTIAVICMWDYPEVQRFLIPFLPLLAASVWSEAKWIAARLSAAMRAPRAGIERVSAAAMAIVLCAFALGIGWNVAADADRAALRSSSEQRAKLLVEKREAYDWLRQNAPPDARVVAGEDAALYLYTGRQAMAHIALQRAGAYDHAYLEEDLDHLTDVAQAIHAQYWFASSDDSDKQWVAAKPLLAARFSEVEGVLPERFRSSGGRVRIYGLGCVQHPQVPECREADEVLFPSPAWPH
jgi:hypothetical protein